MRVRITDRTSFEFKDRSHFFALCATIMRRILADHARTRLAQKRGRDWGHVALTNVPTPSGGDEIDVLDLDDALGRLGERSPRQARIVEYRFFSGMTVDEVAGVLQRSRYATRTSMCSGTTRRARTAPPSTHSTRRNGQRPLPPLRIRQVVVSWGRWESEVVSRRHGMGAIASLSH